VVCVSDILLRGTMPAQAIYDEQHRCNQFILHSQLAGTTSQPSRSSSLVCSQAGRRVETPGLTNGDRPRVRAGTKRQPLAGETRVTCGGTSHLFSGLVLPRHSPQPRSNEGYRYWYKPVRGPYCRSSNLTFRQPLSDYMTDSVKIKSKRHLG